MKIIKRTVVVFAAIFAVCLTLTLTAYAENDDGRYSLSLISSESVDVSELNNCISYGLDVMAFQNQMAIAGICGNALNFSAERFACAMNLSSIDHIVITKLPDAMHGSLYIGSNGVSEGQKISADTLKLMTYEESNVGVGSNASFEFRVNGGTYDVICNIFMIDEINYSPTVRMASSLSLNIETYRDIKISGVLSAYDPEGDELTYEIVKYPSNGIISIDDKQRGMYTYMPNTSYTGSDSFKYVVRDKYGNYSESKEVELTVSAQSTSMVYSDLLDDEIYRYAIAMTENGLMNGIKIGNCYYFEANREISRAEFVVTAMNAIGIKNVPETDLTGFADNADIGEEMRGYISLAYSKGYISGIKSDGNIYFRPDDKIKLSEAAVILSNMIGYAKPDVIPVFADRDSIPQWSSDAIESLYTLGILELPDKTVGANNVLTKGNMAKILNKAMQAIGR